jgi:hypothetical protein
MLVFLLSFPPVTVIRPLASREIPGQNMSSWGGPEGLVFDSYFKLKLGESYMENGEEGICVPCRKR